MHTTRPEYSRYRLLRSEIRRFSLSDDELKQQIGFLESKVEELSKERSSLERDISQSNKEVKAKLEAEYADKLKRMKDDFDARAEKQAQQQKYLDEYLVRLDKQAGELKDKEILLTSKVNAFNVDLQKFTDTRESALREVENKLSDITMCRKNIEAGENNLKISALAQNNERLNLDTKALNIETARLRLVQKEEELNGLITTNGNILSDIQHERGLIEEEKSAVKELLEQIQKEKAGIESMSAYKDDIVALEAEKKELEAKKAEMIKASSAMTKREATILEREQASSEKERYLDVKERELKRDIDKKIEILTKLRAGE